jgi:pimeloyl-ACP methyl ester carboxylesterase
MKYPLVFIPGMMCDSRLFQPQINEFSKQYMVCAAPASSSDTIENISSEILRYLPTKFTLIGLSMGGILAMEIIKKVPERVMKIVLMDTNYKSETAEIKSRRLPQIKLANEGRLEDIMCQQIQNNYLRTDKKNQEIFDLCLSMATDLGKEIFINQSKALATRKDYKSTLKNIKVPSLIICGEHDRICPIKVHIEMESLIENSTLEIIPDAAHLPTLEQPSYLNKIIGKWLLQ